MQWHIFFAGGWGYAESWNTSFLDFALVNIVSWNGLVKVTDVSQTLVYKGLQEMTHFEFMETLSLNKHSTVNNIQFHKSSTKKQAMCVLILWWSYVWNTDYQFNWWGQWFCKKGPYKVYWLYSITKSPSDGLWNMITSSLGSPNKSVESPQCPAIGQPGVLAISPVVQVGKPGQSWHLA